MSYLVFLINLLEVQLLSSACKHILTSFAINEKDRLCPLKSRKELKLMIVTVFITS